ncbi:RNA polymerase sigma factor [Flavonifractor plautii]|uniref:RNA polymerase sigma factor n=2 Tax=Flavonifractor plautii TaxID=292800 RepID=UPI001FA74971|nr:RNA polymerase sigma factor [Flavonifractor plautii]
MIAAMMPDEKELVERLYRLHFKKLFIYANAALRNPELAKDVVQDTFHEAMRRIDVVAKHENPGGWLMNVVKNKLKEYERNRRRDLRYLLSLDADFPDESNLPEELVLAQPETQGEPVLEIIERLLTPEELRLLKRLVFGRASHQQVAQEFGISVYASQKRLERIRDKLYTAFPERKRQKK